MIIFFFIMKISLWNQDICLRITVFLAVQVPIHAESVIELVILKFESIFKRCHYFISSYFQDIFYTIAIGNRIWIIHRHMAVYHFEHGMTNVCVYSVFNECTKWRIHTGPTARSRQWKWNHTIIHTHRPTQIHASQIEARSDCGEQKLFFSVDESIVGSDGDG